MQCCLDLPELTLHKKITCTMLAHTQQITLYKKKKSTMMSGSVWANIAQGNHLCNNGAWLTENFYEENNLYNVVSTMQGQHSIGILSSY